MSAISDCRNCVKVTQLPANPPRRVCFLPAPGTRGASHGGGGEGAWGQPSGLGGGGGLRKSFSSWSSGSQLGLRPKQPPPSLVGGIPEPEGSRGRGCPSALTPEIPQPWGRGVGRGASGKPARSDPTWLVLLLPWLPPTSAQLHARPALSSLSRPLRLGSSLRLPGAGLYFSLQTRGS